MIAHRRRPPARGLRQRGAALIEFALVVPLFVLLIAGSFDFGAAWKVGMIANTATRAGARTGSSAGNTPLADYYLLTGMRSSLQSGGTLAKVTRVILFKSATADGKVPTGCLTGSPGSSPCNIITGAQLTAMTQSSFDSTTGCFTAAATKNWCPSSRVNVQLTADYLGVFVEIQQPYMFVKVLGSGVTIRRTAVMRLEPGD